MMANGALRSVTGTNEARFPGGTPNINTSSPLIFNLITMYIQGGLGGGTSRHPLLSRRMGVWCFSWPVGWHGEGTGGRGDWGGVGRKAGAMLRGLLSCIVFILGPIWGAALEMALAQRGRINSPRSLWPAITTNKRSLVFAPRDLLLASFWPSSSSVAACTCSLRHCFAPLLPARKREHASYVGQLSHPFFARPSCLVCTFIHDVRSKVHTE
ncbi:uncharacterized protein B0H64DRAFT_4840 [Chaetomium fimeti]|uniref:Uncharacterized protein n=1 Tax=Chaetomium fimeti TaxID=1854472 RepID=A0AAE0HNV1_9PEZI|nr:hypothetical protein B0H64DRAFT_4840 [Chaetomium fimeti]